MPQRQGRYTVQMPTLPVLLSGAAVGGKAEGEGPFAQELDFCYPDDGIGSTTWEKAESALHRDAVERAIAKAGLMPENIDLLLAGDLLDQCAGTTFGVRELNMPLCGLFGACSTFALGLAIASVLVDAGAVGTAVASASSHFCSAEKQFRNPLEYGSQRTPTAQRTATAAGAAVVGKGAYGCAAEAVLFGRITDLGVTDANNMGAAMAPAAARSIADFLHDTGTVPTDYDKIFTGDLGTVGSALLLELLQKREQLDISAVHEDCGVLLFDAVKQDVHAGGSGCGCSAAVISTRVRKNIAAGVYKKVLFVGTGALMSPITALQGDSIPSIAHVVSLVHVPVV